MTSPAHPTPKTAALLSILSLPIHITYFRDHILTCSVNSSKEQGNVVALRYSTNSLATGSILGMKRLWVTAERPFFHTCSWGLSSGEYGGKCIAYI